MFDESDLLRFIEGECSPEDAAAIQAWIAADPRRGELLDELRALWRLTGDATRRWDVTGARERLLRARAGPWHERRGLSRPVAGDEPPRRASASPSWEWMRPWRAVPRPARIAAAVALLIAGAALWHLRSPVAPAPFRGYATPRGQRLALSFPDGSRVLLGVDSRLRVPHDYGVRARAVELEGEAYFTVRRDSARPFFVRTAHGTAEVLGTEFDVRAYPEEASLQVVVAAGGVALRGPKGGGSVPLTLGPRDRGVIDARGGATLTPNVSLDVHLAWTRGMLAFDEAPLASVLAQLERWYDLEFHGEDRSLEEERITISFTTESVDEALTALARVLNVRFTRVHRLVQLVPLDSRQ